MRQRRAGCIVNLSSLGGLRGFPALGYYNATKFAVRGFTEALNLELRAQGSKILSVVVHPGGVRTNIARTSRLGGLGQFERDRNEVALQFEQAARTTPTNAANQILKGLERGRHRILVGPDAYLIDSIQRLLPGRYQSIVSRAITKWF
jgi:short-subunit dehydrogenase